MVLGTSYFHPPAPRSCTHTLPLTLPLCPRVSLLAHAYVFCLFSSSPFTSQHPSHPPSSSPYLIDPPWEVASPSHNKRGPSSDKWHAGPTSFAWGEKSFKLRRNDGFDWMLQLRGCILASCIGLVSAKKWEMDRKLQCCCLSSQQYVLRRNKLP